MHLFQVIKIIGKPEISGQKVFYSCYHQTQLKTIQHSSYIISRVVSFCFFILCSTEFQGAHLPCSHVNLSAF